MYKYTHPQTPSITGTVDEDMYLKMKADRVFKGYRWTKVEETAIEPTPEIKPPLKNVDPNELMRKDFRKVEAPSAKVQDKD